MNLLAISDLDRARIECILDRAAEFSESGPTSWRQTDFLDRILVSVFFQPSTRTVLSFQSAMLRLGGQVIEFSDIHHPEKAYRRSEALPDIARVLDGYADVAVVRHTQVGASAVYAAFSDIPVINAGDGIGARSEHPTQALTDLFTIRQALGRLDKLKVLLLGELHQRTTRSLLYGLSKFNGNVFHFCCPESYRPDGEVETDLQEAGCEYAYVAEMADVIADADVIYHCGTRKDPDTFDVKCFQLSMDRVGKVRHDAIIMNPLPRAEDDIPFVVDDRRQARYFQQSRNGVPVRMATLEYALDCH